VQEAKRLFVSYAGLILTNSGMVPLVGARRVHDRPGSTAQLLRALARRLLSATHCHPGLLSGLLSGLPPPTRTRTAWQHAPQGPSC
jgi:hypothetical protein